MPSRIDRRAASIRPEYDPLPEKPNPQAEQARAAKMKYNSEMALSTATHLYPLAAPAPLLFGARHDDGVSLWVDDPASIDAEP